METKVNLRKTRGRAGFYTPRGLLLLTAILLALIGVRGLWRALAAPSGTVSGVVTDSQGPIAGARVRVRATENLTFTDSLGHFTLAGLTDGQEVEIAAWFDGYYIASDHITPTVSGLTLTLRPYHTQDHPGYQWGRAPIG